MSKQSPLRLFFIRHGQTEHHERQIFNGWRDAPLTSFGQKQLEDVVDIIEKIPFKAVYASDLSRAVYGGRCLAERLNLPLEIEPKWREIHFGRWEGLTFREIEENDPELARNIFSLDSQENYLSFPEGENTGSFLVRIQQALTELINKYPDGGRIALFCHGGVCKTLWSIFLKMSPHVAWQTVRQDFAAVNVVDIYSSGAVVAQLMNAYLGPGAYNQDSIGFDRLLAADLF